MEEDELQGLVPFFVSTTLGTTGSCSFDALPEIGLALQRYPSVWLHVDAAYAGNAFICPELKYLLKVSASPLTNRTKKLFKITKLLVYRELNMLIHSTRIPTNGCSPTLTVQRYGSETEFD